MRTLLFPTDKKKFKSQDVILFAFVQYLINCEGKTIDDAKKLIYGTINQADCLSKPDKDARKAQLRKSYATLEESPESKWDLSERLKEAIAKEVSNDMEMLSENV